MLQELVDKKLLAEQESKATRQRSGKWSPSQFGRCYRLQYWRRKDEKPSNPPTITTLRKFKAGTLFHDFIQGLIKDEHKTEVLVEQDDILGFADVVVDDAVIDIKSVHSRTFWWMAKKGFEVMKDKEANILQVITYAWLLNKPRALLCYVSKDDVCINEYEFKVEDWLDKIKKEVASLRDFWGKDKLPPASPRAYNGKECSYCDYVDLCKKTEGGDEKWHSAVSVEEKQTTKKG